MGVYIKGMEMPTSGAYEVSIDNSYGKDKTVMSLFVRGDGGLICCGCYEIVPIQPHGALMDRDDFFATCSELVDGYKHITDEFVVIPAEEGER